MLPFFTTKSIPLKHEVGLKPLTNTKGLSNDAPKLKYADVVRVTKQAYKHVVEGVAADKNMLLPGTKYCTAADSAS